jgi:hypothetical protein
MVNNVEGITNEINAGRALLLLDGLDELGSIRDEDVEVEEGGITYKINADQARLLLDRLGKLDASQEEEIEVELEEVGEKKKVKEKHSYDPRQRFLAHIPKNNRVLMTCRVRDYKQIHNKAALNGAVTLQPLTMTQMQEYLAGYPNLWKAIQSDYTLRELCRTPLLLSIFAYGFGEATEEERQALQNLSDSPAELRDRIFGMYVERRYEHEQIREELPYTLEEIKRLLGEAIANELMSIELLQEDDTSFIPENHLIKLNKNIAQLCQRLHYLVPFENEKNDTGWRFTHLLLRAYFGFPVLVSYLDDDDGYVRWLATGALGAINDTRVVTPLIARLRDDDFVVRCNAAIVLSKIGDQRAIEPLIDCLHDTHPNVRCCVANLLGQTGNDRTVKPLIVCLRDPDRWVRLRTATALARIGDERAVEPLIICLRDEYKGVQLNAAAALNTIATPQATAAVKAYDADRKNFDPEAFLAQWEADHPAE